jgi:hypothetical protein
MGHGLAVHSHEHMWGACIAAILAGSATWLGYSSLAGAFAGLATIEVAFATFDQVRGRR